MPELFSKIIKDHYNFEIRPNNFNTSFCSCHEDIPTCLQALFWPLPMFARSLYGYRPEPILDVRCDFLFSSSSTSSSSSKGEAEKMSTSTTKTSSSSSITYDKKIDHCIDRSEHYCCGCCGEVVLPIVINLMSIPLLFVYLPCIHGKERNEWIETVLNDDNQKSRKEKETDDDDDHSLENPGCCNYLLGCCFFPCSLMQIHREIIIRGWHHRRKEIYNCCSSNKNKSYKWDMMSKEEEEEEEEEMKSKKKKEGEEDHMTTMMMVNEIDMSSKAMSTQNSTRRSSLNDHEDHHHHHHYHHEEKSLLKNTHRKASQYQVDHNQNNEDDEKEHQCQRKHFKANSEIRMPAGVEFGKQ